MLEYATLISTIMGRMLSLSFINAHFSQHGFVKGRFCLTKPNLYDQITSFGGQGEGCSCSVSRF